MSPLRIDLAMALSVCVALTFVDCSKRAVPEEIADEITRREAFAKRVLAEEDAGRAAGVSSRSDVVFEQGFSPIEYDPPAHYRNHAFRWMGATSRVRLKSHGDRRMKLRCLGWINDQVIQTWPVLTATIDGKPVGRIGPIDKDHYWLEAEVGPELFAGREWVDLELVFSSVAFHWSDPPNLQVALVYRFDWEEM